MMRVLSVRQPWAHAIIFLGKDVENRPRNLAGTHRGAIAIHASLGFDDAALMPLRAVVDLPPKEDLQLGMIIGVIDLVDVHAGPHAWKSRRRNPGACEGRSGVCSPWGEKDRMHLVLRKPRPLTEPMPYRGALHLQTMTPADEAELLRRIA